MMNQTPQPIPEQINYNEVNYSDYWIRKSFAFDFEHEPEAVFSNISREQMLGLAWLTSARNQVSKYKLSLIITIEGRHRSGKSIFAVGAACIWDKTFQKNMNRRIVQNADELLELIKEIQESKIHGCVIIVDEAGAAMASTDWFEKLQKAVVKTMTIIGFLHPIIIFISPVNDQISSSLRRMSHIFITVKRKSPHYSTVSPFNVSYDSRRKKYYYPHPKIRVLGTKYKLKKIRVTLPPEDIVKAYQAIEQARKPLMLEDIRKDGTLTEMKKQREIFDPKAAAEFVAKNYQLFETRQSRRSDKINKDISLDYDIIRQNLKCTVAMAKATRNEAEDLLKKKKTDIDKQIEKTEVT